MYLVHGELLCTNSWSIIYSALATMILQGSDKRRSPWPKKLLRSVLHRWKSITARKLRYIILGYTLGLLTLVCSHNGEETIVDFKQANRPKKKEWIEDYYLQIAAYAMAHDYVHNSAINKGVIMVCTPDLYYQEFVVTGAELRQYKHKFLKRLDMYHDLKFDEKEKANIGGLQMKEEDFDERKTT